MKRTGVLGDGLLVTAMAAAALRVDRPATAKPRARIPVKSRLVRDAEGRAYVETRSGRRIAIAHADGRVEIARKATKQERKAMKKTAHKTRGAGR